MSFIEIKNLSFSYSDDDGKPVSVLKNIDLSIEKGEFVAVLGRNGSGKSTLAKLINMILEPDDGTITVDGIKVASPCGYGIPESRQPACSNRG